MAGCVGMRDAVGQNVACRRLRSRRAVALGTIGVMAVKREANRLLTAVALAAKIGETPVGRVVKQPVNPNAVPLGAA